MAYEMDLELVITIQTSKDQSTSRAIEKDFEGGAGGAALCTGHTVGIGTL